MTIPLFIFSSGGCSEYRAGDGHWTCVKNPSQPSDRFQYAHLKQRKPCVNPGLKLKWKKNVFSFVSNYDSGMLVGCRLDAIGGDYSWSFVRLHHPWMPILYLCDTGWRWAYWPLKPSSTVGKERVQSLGHTTRNLPDNTCAFLCGLGIHPPPPPALIHKVKHFITWQKSWVFSFWRTR
jgi:hypothetical protein